MQRPRCRRCWRSARRRLAQCAEDLRKAPEDLISAAAYARLPGRFEHFDYRGATVIVDVAHNPHGAAFLREQLRATQPGGRTIAVAGFLQDKDAAGIVAALAPVVDEWVLVATRGPRGQSAAMSTEKYGAWSTGGGLGVRIWSTFWTRWARIRYLPTG